jgi:hypothetical protein
MRIQPILLIALAACVSLAQTPATLIGTWHNVTQPQFPQGILMISEDGYYSQITVSPGRKEPAHDFDHRTREELAKQFGGFRASYGTWKTVDNKFIQTVTDSHEPSQQGKEITWDFRFDGQILVLTSPDGHGNRYRPMR